MFRSLTRPRSADAGSSGHWSRRRTIFMRLHRNFLLSSLHQTLRRAAHPSPSFPLDGGGASKGVVIIANDRSTAQRSQPNRLKCNHHVTSTGQFIPFGIPNHSARNLFFITNLPSSTLLRPRFSSRRYREPDHRFCLHVTCIPSPSKGWIFVGSALQPLLYNFKTLVGGKPYPQGFL